MTPEVSTGHKVYGNTLFIYNLTRNHHINAEYKAVVLKNFGSCRSLYFMYIGNTPGIPKGGWFNNATSCFMQIRLPGDIKSI